MGKIKPKRRRPLTFEQQLFQRIKVTIKICVEPLIEDWPDLTIDKKEDFVEYIHRELYRGINLTREYIPEYTVLAKFCFCVLSDPKMSEIPKERAAELLANILSKENSHPAKGLLISNLQTIRQLPKYLRDLLAKNQDKATRNAMGID